MPLPLREPDPEAVKVNQQNLREVTSAFLDQLANSVELLPHQVQTVCRSLHKVGRVGEDHTLLVHTCITTLSPPPPPPPRCCRPTTHSEQLRC